jgi:hypothetical protein
MGTTSGETGVVVLFTKSMMACLAGPSFRAGSGSAACAIPLAKTVAKTIVASKALIGGQFMSVSLPMF